MSIQKKLILATTSPHRIKAFKELGIPFETENSHVDEDFSWRPNDPIELVLCLSELKAKAVAINHRAENCFVIGFDSVGCFDGKILEKPKTKVDAFQRLKAMSGKSFEFYTGIFLIENYLQGGQSTAIKSVKTISQMRKLKTSEINRYLDQDPNFNTYAIGFNTLGTYGSTFIEAIYGSYNNILHGLPLEAVTELLNRFGFKV